MGLFCSELLTDYLFEVRFSLSPTTYAKIAKNRRKIGPKYENLDFLRRRIPIFFVGTFLRRIFDADSNDVSVLNFGPPETEKSLD